LGLTIFGFASAQIPNRSYNGTNGLTGAALKTKPSQFITTGHVQQGYGSGSYGL